MLIHNETRPPPPPAEPVQQPEPELPEILTLREAAVLLRRHVESLRLMIRRGECPVPVRKIGRRNHLLRSDIEAFLGHTDPTRPAA